MSTDQEESYDVPDKALFDNTSTIGGTSDAETFSTFEEILRKERVWKTIETSDHSRSSISEAHSRGEAAEVLWETQACWMRTRTQCNEYTEDVGSKMNVYAYDARATINEYLEDFFSEEQKRERAKMASNALSAVRVGLTSCHDSVDSFLVGMFDQPLREVGVNPEMQLTYTMTVNETLTDEMTVETHLTGAKNRIERKTKPTYADANEHFLAPVNEEKNTSKIEASRAKIAASRAKIAASRSNDTSASSEEAEETDIASLEETVDLADSLGANHTLSASTDEDDEDDDSVLRFKESLYKRYEEVSQKNPSLDNDTSDAVKKNFAHGIAIIKRSLSGEEDKDLDELLGPKVESEDIPRVSSNHESVNRETDVISMVPNSPLFPELETDLVLPVPSNENPELENELIPPVSSNDVTHDGEMDRASMISHKLLSVDREREVIDLSNANLGVRQESAAPLCDIHGSSTSKRILHLPIPCLGKSASSDGDKMDLVQSSPSFVTENNRIIFNLSDIGSTSKRVLHPPNSCLGKSVSYDGDDLVTIQSSPSLGSAHKRTINWPDKGPESPIIHVTDDEDTSSPIFYVADQEPTGPTIPTLGIQKAPLVRSLSGLAKSVIDPYRGIETIDCSEVEERDAEETCQPQDSAAEAADELIDLTMFDEVH